jgi:hypothetical protein
MRFRRHHELEKPAGIDICGAPGSVGPRHAAMDRGTEPFAAVGRDAVDLDGRADQRPVGRHAGREPGHEAVERNLRLGNYAEPLRLAPRYEFVDLAKRPRVERQFPVIELAEHEVGRAAQAGTLGGDPGRRAGFPDETAVGLRVFVVAVAAQGEERGAGHDVALAGIEMLQERRAGVELVAGIEFPVEHALVGHAAKDGMADVLGPAILNVVADSVAAARTRDQRHARRSGALPHRVHGGRELAQLVGSRRAPGLRLGVIVARQRVREVERQQMVARKAIGFASPQIGDPQRRMIAVAVHEHQRHRGLAGRHRGGSLRPGRGCELGCEERSKRGLQDVPA